MKLKCIFIFMWYLVLNFHDGYGKIQNEASIDESKIVHGDIISISERPYQAFIMKRGNFSCGGVIISEQWSLTAAHCATRNASDYMIRVGDVQNHTVSRVVQHPKYRNDSFGYDYAVMQVSTPFSIGQPGIAAIRMASSLPSTGTTVTASGWGLTRYLFFPQTSKELRKADMKIVSRRFCNFVWHQPTTDNSMFCARGRQNGNHGDSGGPLTVKTSNGDELVGLVSAGKIRWTMFGGPALFASVPFARSWIRDTTGV